MSPRNSRQAICDSLRSSFEEMKVWSEAARESTDDSVHKTRIASRRLRSTMRIFRNGFAKGATHALEAELKWLGEQLGAQRDAEVLRASVGEAINLLPELLRGGEFANLLDKQLKSAASKSGMKLRSVLNSPRFYELMANLDAFVMDPPILRGFGREDVSACITMELSAVSRSVSESEKVEGDLRESNLHEARKSAKRLRYAIEAVGGSAGRKAQILGSSMKDLQDHLGIVHDCSEARKLLSAICADHLGIQGSAEVVAFLEGIFAERSRVAEARFWAVWATIGDTWCDH